MPRVTVDQHGSQYYYEDTGAPHQSSDYTTLILVHGAGFQGAVFEPLFAHAAARNMRLVAVNMRDYYGSTPYSASELADLGSTDVERQAKAIRARGLEILTFLLWFIRKESIPPLLPATEAEDWAMEGYHYWADELAPNDVEFLAGYMRALVLYDPAPRAFGAPMSSLQDSYNPLNDSSLSPEQMKRVFPSWVSGYYTHSKAMLDALPSLSRDALVAGFSQDPVVDSPIQHTPTILRMSDGELARVVNEDAVAHSHILYEHVDGKVYSDNVRKALCHTSIWPGLRVVLVWFNTIGQPVDDASVQFDWKGPIIFHTGISQNARCNYWPTSYGPENLQEMWRCMH
ncbi:uncharacterized protein B0H18DRAFT_1211859 [Fomitopsis serialis]|uniref:uncharacterized protein n=1 Tax=Fomitopsis serialis TaxID=139415 RepID=UPI002007B64E|nr:uncharacterized protein B0H18DRAFT_1211859 [Neoantrodia serialis]KAH9924415.1 hypothetical protein B0H18DRAFT_1211859 [Neoantrodia serialis]